MVDKVWHLRGDPHGPTVSINPRDIKLDNPKDVDGIVAILRAHGFLHLKAASYKKLDPSSESLTNANHPVSF